MNDNWSPFTYEPAWPWSSPNLGLPWTWPFGHLGKETLALIALTLVGLTIWTYMGVRGASRRRIMILAGLRLVALMIACMAVLRPSLVFRDEERVPTTLIIAADDSQSMKTRDQAKGESMDRACVFSPVFRQLQG